jgi:cytochrome c553
MSIEKRKPIVVANILFIFLCGVILLVLLRAPKETTPKLPNDAQHAKFRVMKSKSEAEKFCGKCHSQNGEAPLPANHPPKYRCLFCHKM